MSRDTVTTEKAPAAIGPYSQGVIAGGFVFVSGQIPLHVPGGTVEEGSIGRQTEMVLRAAGMVLEAAGSSLELAVKVTVYMTDLSGFGEMNEVYAGFFQEHPPARSVVEVSGLPKGVGIEIEVVALEGGA